MQAATENVKKMITYYGDSTKDEAGVITKALDLFQEQVCKMTFLVINYHII